MKLALAGVALVMAGCATVTPEQVTTAARNATNYELCEALVLGAPRWAGLISAEIDRRSLDCNQYASTIQLKLQNRQAQSRAMMDAANYFNRPAPQLPMPVTCDSYRMGNRVEITCR